MANDEDDDQDEEEEEGSDMEEEVNAVNKCNAAKSGGKRKMDDDDYEEEDIETKYDLADYDNEDEIGKNVHCTEWFSSWLIILFCLVTELRLLEFYKCKNEILEGHIDWSIDLIYSDCEGWWRSLTNCVKSITRMRTLF